MINSFIVIYVATKLASQQGDGSYTLTFLGDD